MTDDAEQIMRELREDHRNMTLLLNLLERESNEIYGGDNADFDLVYDIMLYMTVYPDAVHHPKEDRIYAELKAVRPELAGGMSRVTAEHRDIADHGLAVRAIVDRIISGDMVPRNTVVGEVTRYITKLRDHMRWEESDLFRRVDNMIRDGHRTIDQSTIIQYADPVFGPAVEDRFARLLDNIKIAEEL